MDLQGLVPGIELGEALAGGRRPHPRELSGAIEALRGAAPADPISFAVVWAAAGLVEHHDAARVRAELPKQIPDRALHHVLQRVLPAATADLDALRDHIVACAQPHLGSNFARAHVNAGVALLGGVHALAVALAEGIQPRAALQSVAALGRDADLVAGLCGGLLCARFGTDWI